MASGPASVPYISHHFHSDDTKSPHHTSCALRPPPLNRAVLGIHK